MKKFMAMLAVLGLVSAVQANILMSVTPIAGTAGTVTKFGTVYQGYVIRLWSGGVGVASIDGTFTANGNKLLQRTLFTYDPNMNDGEGGYTVPAIPTAGYNTYKDTHFMLQDSWRLDVTLDEDSNAVCTGALDNAYGTGTYLRGIFGIKTFANGGPDQTNGLDFAAIWIPQNSADGTVVFDGKGTTYANSTAVSVVLPPSEGYILDAGGAYSVGAGGTISLSAGDFEIPITSWLWDLDGDRNYDDASGKNTIVSYDYLVNTLGLSIGSHSIFLQGAGEYGTYHGFTTLTIVPEPATVGLLVLGGLALRRRR